MDTSTNGRVPDCPYVGLQPYTEAERDYFFGREQDTETIAANLLTAPLTLLYGASGVGKTSVLAAGVAPYLRAMPDVLIVTFRSWQDETFLTALETEIIRTVSDFGTSLENPEHLRNLSFDEYLARAAQETHRTLLIILDQFEEYFLYHPNASPFDEQFARAVNRGDVNVNFLLSLREDALAQLDRFETRIPNLMSNGLRLEHLNRDGAECAIRKPLDVYNARRTGEPPITIEDGLVDTLIEQVRTGRVTLGQAGQGTVGGDLVSPQTADTRNARIETPFLQMVLTRLWDEETRTGSHNLKLATLNRLGGAEKIVRTHLDAVMNKLTAPEQEVCWSIFDRLVTPSGSKVVQSANDLAVYAVRPADLVISVLKKLADARVLRPIVPPLGLPQTMCYEIFHDALVPAILDWRIRKRETPLGFMPIFSRIPAGDPRSIPEHPIEYIEADRLIIGGKPYYVANSIAPGLRLTFSPHVAYIAFPVIGDSMNNAGIDNGDYVILRTNSVATPELSPETGDIVAVVLPEEETVTLKRFRRKGEEVIFEPDSKNPNHKPYHFQISKFGFSGKIIGIHVATLKPL